MNFLEFFQGIYTFFQDDPEIAVTRLFLVALGLLFIYLAYKKVLEALIMLPLGIGMIAVNAGLMVMEVNGHSGVGNLFVNSGLGGKEPDHDRLLIALLDRPTEDARVPLVYNLLYSVVVNVFSALADLTSARRAGGDLFPHRLVTRLTQFHGLFPEIGSSGTVASYCRGQRPDHLDEIIPFLTDSNSSLPKAV